MIDALPVGEAPLVVAPSPTPFREDDAVDYGAVERNVQRWLATPLSGFVLNSENGEEAFLSEHERLEIVRTVRRAAGGRKLTIGGVDSPSVAETLRIAKALVQAGADLIVIGRGSAQAALGRLRTHVYGVVQQSPCPVLSV